MLRQCKSFEIVPLIPPANLEKVVYENDMAQKIIWETKMKGYLKQTDLMESNTRAIYTIVWGQCSPLMQSKLESPEHYGDKSERCDCIWILKEIQGITHKLLRGREMFLFHSTTPGAHTTGAVRYKHKLYTSISKSFSHSCRFLNIMERP